MRRRLLMIVIVVCLGLAACNPSPTPTQAPPVIPTQTPQPTATFTPAPTVTPLPTATATPHLAATAAVCRPVAQVSNVTALANAVFKPGEVFTQTWRLQNVGNCAWERGSTLAFKSGDPFGTATAIPVDAVEVGKSIEVSAIMTAPQSGGTHVSLWLLQRPSGQIIAVSEVRIRVALPTPVPIVILATSPAQPGARRAVGNIPPVGSGPFSVDESASGPWNCVMNMNGTWAGDFYIGAYGGPGNYTISDPEHCQWDLDQNKFVCRLGARWNQALMLTLQVSCPGCTPQKVALYGRGVTSRETGPGICRIPAP